MREFLAIVTGLALGCSAMVAPTLATTTGGATNNAGDYSKHAMDCLALLFTDPKAHDEQCGGPNFIVPDPPHGTTGFAPACNVVEIDPFGIDGVQYRLVASTCCGYGSISPSQWQPLGTDILVWGEPAFRVALSGC
jgi:hypothetical protein